MARDTYCDEKPTEEEHFVSRIGWLRAAVLGANDGILSTAALIAGVASADASLRSVLIAGIAGLVSGAMSMAAGEYVSVSSQGDTEKAELGREARELRDRPDYELRELACIYEQRGVEPALALEVAKQLSASDALGTHAREELGINEVTAARPVVAALTSAVTFSTGAAVPLLATVLAPQGTVVVTVTVASLICLAILGALAATAGGSDVTRATVRVTFWGAFAMVLTSLIGKLSGVAV